MGIIINTFRNEWKEMELPKRRASCSMHKTAGIASEDYLEHVQGFPQLVVLIENGICSDM